MIQQPPRSPLLPYTALFRSDAAARAGREPEGGRRDVVRDEARVVRAREGVEDGRDGPPVERSEEHTTELQSRQYLACRLLLEKTYAIISSVLCQHDHQLTLL